MKRLLLPAVALSAMLLAAACAALQPGPGNPPSPASAPPLAIATRAAVAATARPTVATAPTDQPVAAATPAPVSALTEEFAVRSGKLLVAADLRAAADESAPVLGQKSAGAIVVVTGVRGDWYEIVSGLADDGHAWLPRSAVTLELTAAAAAPAATAALAASATPAATAGGPAAAVRATSPAPPTAPAPAAADLPGALVFQDAPGGTIYLMNADGSGLRRLTAGLEPALSPDGSQVAFARWDEPRGLWLVNRDGSNERLVFGANRVRSPSWTPDGQSVVFERSAGSRECRVSPFGCLTDDALWQLFGGADCLDTPFGRLCIDDFTLVTNWLTALTRYNLADGTDRDLPAGEKSTAPQVAPAGSELVFLEPGGFSATRTEGNEVPWPVVRDKATLGPAAYSPDGQYLFAAREQHDHWQIWRWRVDGSQAVALTLPDPLGANTSNNVAPSVSPDGKSVAFLTDRAGKWELWVMNTDGGSQRPLAPAALADIEFRYDFNSDRSVNWGS